MKFSTAIRKGAKLRPQGFGSPMCGAKPGTSCAVVAALEGSLGSLDEAINAYIADAPAEMFPVLKRTLTNCPADPNCEGNHFKVGGVMRIEGAIYHLNDDHKWTREQIAKWVSQFERVNA